jgi:hypothetical protein
MKADAASDSIINRISQQVIQVNHHGNYHETISSLPVQAKEKTCHNCWHAKME